MAMLHKSFPVYNFKVLDEGQGLIEAIVSVYNYIDSGGDRVLYGAFNNSLKKRTPKGVRMHDWNQPVAKTLLALELPPNDARLPPELKQYGGLYIKGQYNLETAVGRETFSDVKFGTLDEYSIGYGVVREQKNAQLGCNDLQELDLYEWSNVLFGMNDQTTTISAKQVETTLTPLADALQKKSQYLGTYAEANASFYGISSLLDTFMYNVAWPCMSSCCNGTMTKDDCMAMMNAGCMEMCGLIMKMCEAMMPDMAEDTGEMEMEMKLLFQPVEEKQVSNRIAVKLHKETEELARFSESVKARIQALLRKEGRVFSDANWSKLDGCTEKIGETYDEMRSLLDSAKVEKSNLALLRYKFENESI